MTARRISRCLSTLLLFVGIAFSTSGNPVIYSANPVHGSVQTGGATIILTGQGFSGQAQVALCGFCFGDQLLRPTQRVGSTQLIVQLQPGDLAGATVYSIAVAAKGANGASTGFLWSVDDGTIAISPGDAVASLSQRIQFSATSSIPGDSIQWSIVCVSASGQCPNPSATIDQTGLFVSPSSLSQPFHEGFGVMAQSVIDPTKSSLVMVTVQ